MNDFIIEKTEYTNKDYSVSIKDKESHNCSLGIIKEHYKQKGKYYISKIGNDYNLTINQLELPLPLFNSKEDAAKALYCVVEGINANPLGEEMRRFLRDHFQQMCEERQFYLKTFFELEHRRLMFAHFAKKYNLDFMCEADIKEEVKGLLDFMDKENDAMYEHLGKDFARSLRAYVASVVRLVDPIAAGKI